MNLKATGFLFGALIVLLLVFFAFQLFGVKSLEERTEAAKWAFPTLHDPIKPASSSDFTRVVVDRKSPEAVRMEFVKEGGNWKMIAPKNVRTDTGAVNRLVDEVISAEKERYAHLEKQLADHGLDKPNVVVTLYRGDQTSVLSFGQEGPGKDPVIYAVSSDEPKQPLAVKKNRVDKVYAAIDDFRDKNLIGSSFDIHDVSMTGTGRKPMELHKENDRDWVFKEPRLGEADNQSVNDFLTTVSGMRVEKNEDFVADGKMDDAELSRYGLAEGKATYVITTKRKNPEKDAKEDITETVLIGAKDTTAEKKATMRRGLSLVLESVSPQPFAFTQWLAPVAAESTWEAKDKDASEPYFAKRADDSAIVRIDGKQVKKLEKSVDDFRGKRLVKIDGTKADAINLATKGETLRLRRPQLKVEGGAASAPEWDLYTDSRAKVKSQPNSVTQLIDDLNKVAVSDAKAFLDTDDKQRAWFVDKDNKPEPVDLGLDKPQAEIWVWEDAIQRKDGKPEGDGEPKIKDDVKAKPKVKLFFGRKDDKRNVVYVKRQVGEEPATILAIPDPFFDTPPTPPMPGQPPPMRHGVNITQRVTGGYLAFRDHTLPSFRLDTASKLAYQRGGESYEAEKEEKKDEKGGSIANWLLKKPVEGKAQNVDMLLNMFLNLQVTPETLVTDRPTDRDVKEKFGLDKPLIKAVVTVKEKDNKTSAFTYLVGKKTDADGATANHFFARLEKKPAEGEPPDTNQFVFLLPAIHVQTLDMELRDGTIFAEETGAKPEEVTFTWHGLDKDKKPVVTKLELSSADKKSWVVKSLAVNGKDSKAELSKLDTAKIEQLLGSSPSRGPGPRLNPLVTPRFVVQNGKPDPAKGLDSASKDKPPALVIDIKLDNKTNRVLTIGDRWQPTEAEAPGLAKDFAGKERAYYYATASTLPNATFVLPEADFKELVSGVAFFKAAEKVSLR